MWLVSFTVFFLNWVQAAPAISTPSNCLRVDKLLEVSRDFEFVVATDGKGRPAVPTLDPCDREQLAYKVYEAILFLKGLPPLTTRLDVYDRGALDEAPFDFFRRRIRTIRFESDSNPECGNGESAAFVKPNEDKLMHICSGSQQGTLLQIAATLLHEARHIDGYPHRAFCNHGRLVGNPGCDKSYLDRGAYAIEVEFGIRLARTTSLPRDLREKARAMAVGVLLENFNETPFNVRPGYFLQDVGDRVGFFDNAGFEPLFDLTPNDDLLILRSQIPTVYDFTGGNVRAYLNETISVDGEGSYAALFRGLSTPDERRKILDIVYHKRSSCLLYVDRIYCARGTNETELVFKKIKPRSLTVLADMIAVMDEKGYAYPISHEIIGTVDLNEERLNPTARPLGVLSMAAESFSVHLGIDASGTLRRYEALGDPERPGVVVPALAAKKYKKILGPVWWSSEVARF